MSSHAHLRPAAPCLTTFRPHSRRPLDPKAATAAERAQIEGPRPPHSPPAKPPAAKQTSGHALFWLLNQKARTASTFLLLILPALAFGQASPFQTGATALQTSLLTLLTPVAVILVIGLGVMAMANRIAWGWCIGAIAGIAIAFGAPQIVGWIRGMFGV